MQGTTVAAAAAARGETEKIDCKEGALLCRGGGLDLNLECLISVFCRRRGSNNTAAGSLLLEKKEIPENFRRFRLLIQARSRKAAARDKFGSLLFHFPVPRHHLLLLTSGTKDNPSFTWTNV